MEFANDPACRDRARHLLIAKYFPPSERIALYELLGLPTPSDIQIEENAAYRSAEDAMQAGREAKFRIREQACEATHLATTTTYRLRTLAVCRRLNELVGKLPTCIQPEAMVRQVNQVFRGWANYFCYGTYTSAHQIVHMHICRRVRRWLRRKFEGNGQGYGQYPDSYLEQELGLLNIRKLPRRYSWAKP